MSERGAFVVHGMTRFQFESLQEPELQSGFASFIGSHPTAAALAEPGTLRILEANQPAVELLGLRADAAGRGFGLLSNYLEASEELCAFKERLSGKLDARLPSGVNVEIRSGDCAIASQPLKLLLLNKRQPDTPSSSSCESELAELALRRSERLLRATVEASGAGIVVIDASHTVVDSNRRFAEMWSLPSGALKGRSSYELFEMVKSAVKDPASHLENAERFRESDKTASDAVELKDGRVFEYFSSPLIEDGAITGRVWSFHDITAKRKIKEELRRLNEELEARIAGRTADLALESARSRRLESLVREIGERERQRLGRDLHDMLGQTLTALAMKGEVLKNKLFSDSSPHTMEASNMLDAIKEAMKQARNLSRLLCPVKIESQPIRESLMELCASVKSGLGIECLCEVKALKRFETLGAEDKVNIYRIVQEAISNAIKHGRCRTIAVSLSAKRQEGLLQIEDDGAGLPAAESRSEGIGIPIMRSRAEMLGGRLELASRQPSGVTVKCGFPLKAKEA